jgi:hypothetical protein
VKECSDVMDGCGSSVLEVNSKPCFLNGSTCASKEDVVGCEDLGSLTACHIQKGEFPRIQMVGGGCVWGRKTSESIVASCVDNIEVSNCSQLMQSAFCEGEGAALTGGRKCEWLQKTGECVEVNDQVPEGKNESRMVPSDFLWMLILIALWVMVVSVLIIIISCTVVKKRKKKQDEKRESTEAEKVMGGRTEAEHVDVFVNELEENVEGEEEVEEFSWSDYLDVDANEIDKAATKGLKEYLDALTVNTADILYI